MAEVTDAEVEGEDEIHRSIKPRVAERVAIHISPEVEPQNLDFDVNVFLRSSPNPVVASVFGNCEIIQRAGVRRGYPVMRSRFLNFGDDIHDQPNLGCDSTNSTPTFDSGITKPRVVAHSQLCHFSSSERAD